MSLRVGDYIESAATTPLVDFVARTPWDMTQNSEAIVRRLMTQLGPDYRQIEGAFIHGSATIEIGAIIKGPVVIGPECYIAANSLIRGGCWLNARSVIGPGVELKSSFLFAGVRLAHLNFVGDSVLGAEVNLEAGAMIANYRNEWADKRIRFKVSGAPIDTGVEKFGSIVGDGARIGANA
ncbi:MAG: hypothetical protein ABW199_12315, partial [Caulobacterales bacterium]